MTKEELIAKELDRYMLEPKHIYHGTESIPAALHRAMNEYAKQQAIAFARHFTGFISLDDSYLGGKYMEFIEQQQNKQ